METAFIEACRSFIEPNRFRLDEPMKLHTTFKIGGPADCLIFPASMEEVERVMALVKKYDLPLTILGNGSNVLVQDGGIRGVVVK
ncbi:MAG: FAD-binding protein, partial [Mitsuokella sp.]